VSALTSPSHAQHSPAKRERRDLLAVLRKVAVFVRVVCLQPPLPALFLQFAALPLRFEFC
jgi:hypothetical protein